MSAIRDQIVWVIVRIIVSVALMLAFQCIFKHMDAQVILLLDLLIILVLEPVDSIPMKLKHGSQWTMTQGYQMLDKAADILLEFVALILYLARTKVMGIFELVLIALYVYRLIGVSLYLLTGNGMFLVIFPNFFMENVMLYLLLSKVFKMDTTPTSIIVAISVPLKILYEYVHHMVIVK